MIHRIGAVAINTFRETVRDRVLIVVLGVGGVLLLSTLALGELSYNEERRVTMDLGLASISMIGVVTTIFLGSSLLYKEMERKTLYVVLPKPIRREEFLFGKFCGIVLTLWVLLTVLASVHIWIFHLQLGGKIWHAGVVTMVLGGLLAAALVFLKDPVRVWLPWSLACVAISLFASHASTFDTLMLATSYALTFAEAVLLTAVAMLFSSFSRPFLTGALSFGIWILGRSAGEMETMKSKILAPWIRDFLHGFARGIPNFHLFVPGRSALETYRENLPGLTSYATSTLGYAGALSMLLMVVAMAFFRRRDLL